jgi:hypothetical protein
MPRTAKEVAAYSAEHPYCADPYHCGKVVFRGNRWVFESVCSRCAIVEQVADKDCHCASSCSCATGFDNHCE